MNAEPQPAQVQRGNRRRWLLPAVAAVLALNGLVLGGVALANQHHAPQPARRLLGQIPAANAQPRAPIAVGPTRSVSVARYPAPLQLAPSRPLAVSIPAIGVKSTLLQLGLNANHTIQVPSLFALPSQAGWYKYSPTPGSIGPSVILGHIDTYKGPSVFYNLGAMRPGELIDVTLADGEVAVFRANAVASYLKTTFPTSAVYGNTNYAALRLITCGGAFDSTTHQYLSSTVVYATLIGSHPVESAPNLRRP